MAQLSGTENECAICHGTGFVHPLRNGKPDYSSVIYCRCVKAKLEIEKRQWLLENCRLPPFAQNMTFNNFSVYTEVKQAYLAAKTMAEKPNELCWLALLGGNGTGKTHLAVSVCQAWIEARVPSRYAFVSLLLDELREGFRREDDYSYGERFRYYCNIPLLVLDDYGVESSTPWVQEKLDTIIDYRLMNNLSLIVTSNRSLDEMPPRIRSRLARHPKSVIVAIIAEDYALRKGGKH